MKVRKDQEEERKKKKKRESELEKMIFQITERSLKAALDQALDEIFKEWK